MIFRTGPRSYGMLFLLVACLAPELCAQSLSKEKIGAYTSESFSSSLHEFVEFLKLPNTSKNKAHTNQNLNWCLTTFKDLGFETHVLISDSVPHLLASRLINKKLPTLLFYLQIDGQPVDISEWHQANAFEAAFKRPSGDTLMTLDHPDLAKLNADDRIFARSASDSKGPAMTFITALRILKEKKITPSYNLKVIMDFQEEAGSPTLPALVRANMDKFKADAMLIMDGTRHVSNLPTLTFGARGIATITLKVFGPRYELHSGQYGNYAPNPVFGLSRLLAGMKDESGRVIIPGFYGTVAIDDEKRRLLRIEQEDEHELIKQIGISKPEAVGTFYQEALQYPSLNVRGLRAASVGSEVRTIIPAEALAEIDIRLVPETPGERQVALVKKYVEDQGYKLIESDPTPEQRAQYPKLASFTYRIGSKPFRTDVNSALGKWSGQCMEFLFGGNFVCTQMTGGSQPIEPFISTLGIPALSVRIPNPDNNIHAANENIRIGNYREGIEMCLSMLTHRYP